MSVIAPVREAVGGDELVGLVAEHVDERVADADDVEAASPVARSRAHAIEPGMPVTRRGDVRGRSWARRGRSRRPTVVTRP